MKISYLDLKRVTALHSDEIRQAVEGVVNSGWYLQGEQTRAFEAEYAHYIGTDHCVGCGNGLDALTLTLRAYIEMGAMNEGDEVIVPANTYIATILAITENRLKPVLVEPSIDTFQIDDSRIVRSITSRTRAIMIVHLYGRCAYTELIGEICRRHGLLLIEDNAQAHGCLAPNGRRTGSLGHAACHSFYPGKNLGALGDAGAVTTNDKRLAETVRSIANYGSARKYVFDYIGRNSRIDELQAAVLRVKLRHLDNENARRNAIAMRYIGGIANPAVAVPSKAYANNNVFHIFPLLCQHRDELQRHLADNGIQTIIHYPIPPHRQKCYTSLASLALPATERIHREELSLPLNQAMTDEEVGYIIKVVNDFNSQSSLN